MAQLNPSKFLAQIIKELVESGVLEDDEDGELRDKAISNALDAKIKEKEQEKREREKAAGKDSK